MTALSAPSQQNFLNEIEKKQDENISKLKANITSDVVSTVLLVGGAALFFPHLIAVAALINAFSATRDMTKAISAYKTLEQSKKDVASDSFPQITKNKTTNLSHMASIVGITFDGLFAATILTGASVLLFPALIPYSAAVLAVTVPAVIVGFVDDWFKSAKESMKDANLIVEAEVAREEALAKAANPVAPPAAVASPASPAAGFDKAAAPATPQNDSTTPPSPKGPSPLV